MELILAICLGIGLAAACGLRVFLPLAVLSAATRLGIADPGAGFEWIATTPAFALLLFACLAEALAYSVPWVDHALDVIASPLAILAGGIAAAAAISDISPAFAWSAALIAGAGIAGTVQAGSVATRSTTTLTTGGMANPAVSAVETTAAATVSVASILAPALGVLLILVAIVAMRRLVRTARARLRRMPLRPSVGSPAESPALAAANP